MGTPIDFGLDIGQEIYIGLGKFGKRINIGHGNFAKNNKRKT